MLLSWLSTVDAIRVDRNVPDAEIWPEAPARLSILNPYFERTRYQPGIRILTENGWRTAARPGNETRILKVLVLVALAQPHRPSPTGPAPH